MHDVCRLVEAGKLVYCEDLSFRAPVFRDRFHGGELLGSLLAELGYSRSDVALFALAAGGIPVTYATARRLRRPFDVIVVKKMTYPWTTEAGFGAASIDGSYAYDEYAAHVLLRYSREEVSKLAGKVRDYVARRTTLLRGATHYARIDGLTAVVIDDGIATGYTMLVAIRFVKRLGAREVVAAAPTACLDGAELVSSEASKVVTLNLRTPPYAVADAYMEWHDVSDEEAKDILERAAGEGLFVPRLPDSKR